MRSTSAIFLTLLVIFEGHVLGQTRARATVRPCSNYEWQIALSDEAKRLTEPELKYYGGFNKCESASIAFLPSAKILRLETPMDVDAAYAPTLVRPTERTPLQLISSGRGTWTQRTMPNDQESISALNSLLATATRTPAKADIVDISQLYFLIIGFQRGTPWQPPFVSRAQPLSSHAHRGRLSISQGTAEVRYSDIPWKLTFKMSGISTQLVSAEPIDH